MKNSAKTKSGNGWKKMNKLAISVIISVVFSSLAMAQGQFDHLDKISKFNAQLDAHEAAIADLQASDAKTKEELKSLSERLVKLENVEVSPVSTPASPVVEPVGVPVDSLPPVVEIAPTSFYYTYPSTVTYTPTYTPTYSTPTYPVYSYPQYSTPHYNQQTYATPIRNILGNCVNGNCPRR